LDLNGSSDVFDDFADKRKRISSWIESGRRSGA
jgi:hypothetical protein